MHLRLIRNLVLVFTVSICGNPAYAVDPAVEGLTAYNEGQWEKAYQLLTPVAEEGSPIAQTLLGLMHFYGNGVDENDFLAFRFFSAAADQGYPEAQYHLGNMYVYGHAIVDSETNSDRIAAKWFIRAASQGYADAEYTLGLLLLAGTGVIQDPEEALVWINRAAESGHPQARAFIGEYANN